MVDVVLKDLRLSAQGDSRLAFGGLGMVIVGGYLEMVALVPSRHVVKDVHGNGRYVIVRLIDTLTRASRLWNQLDVLRLKTHNSAEQQTVIE